MTRHKNLRYSRALHSNLASQIILEINLPRQEVEVGTGRFSHLKVVSPCLVNDCFPGLPGFPEVSWQSISERCPHPIRHLLTNGKWDGRKRASPPLEDILRCISKDSREGSVRSSNQRPALLSRLGCFLSLLLSHCLSVLLQGAQFQCKDSCMNLCPG